MTLITELAKSAYTGLTDEQAAAAVNAVNVAAQTPIAAADVRRVLMISGAWPRIAALARGLVSGTDPEKLTAVALVEALDSLQSFDFTVPAYKTACQTVLAACVSVGLMSQQDRDNIEALQTTQVPLWRSFGSAPVTAAQVHEQRNA